MLLFAIRLAYRQPVYKRQDRGKWQARIVGANGRGVAKLFDRKADAVRWEAEQLAARDPGDWIDPRDGKVTFAEFYADWSARQMGVDDDSRHEPCGPAGHLRRRADRSHPSLAH